MCLPSSILPRTSEPCVLTSSSIFSWDNCTNRYRMGGGLRTVTRSPWRFPAVAPRLSGVCCRAYSQSQSPAGREEASRTKKKGPRLVKGSKKQGIVPRIKTLGASLRVLPAAKYYQAENHDQQPDMPKTKQRARRAQEAAAAAALAGDSMASSKSTAMIHQMQGQQQKIPYLSVWPGTNQMLDPNAFANGFVHQLPQAMQHLDPFSMALAQPNLYSGLQPLPLPGNMPNSANMGFGSGLSGLFPQDKRFASISAPNQQLQPHYSTPPPIELHNTHTSIPTPPAEYNAIPMPTTRSSIIAADQKAARDRGRNTISAPSAESGGVPDPTPAYLMRASFLPKRRPNPGPLLVVIDLNGTVLYRPSRKNSTNFLARRHAHQFINYCIDTFWVVIWSSARPENVRRMVAQLVPPAVLPHVVAVWGRDRFSLTQNDYNARTQCYKRLTTLWNDPLVKSAYPSLREGFEGGCWNQGNTVLIDDSAEKARSEPHNAITLPEFMGDMEEQGDILPRVHDYLNELCYHEDVSAYMRANPFKMA